MNFDHIFNWRLLTGSHEVPGPDGGTCINEAAIVAAGFEYKGVRSATDCPLCFSRPISAYAIALNDAMPDDLRQRLLTPFVTRLAGTADTPEIELRRAEFILTGLVRDVVSIPLRGWKDDLAVQFGAVTTLEEAEQACNALARALDLDLACALDLDVARARALARILDVALDVARARALDVALEIFETAARLLDGALRIGNQAEPLDYALVSCRMDAAKAHGMAGVEG